MTSLSWPISSQLDGMFPLRPSMPTLSADQSARHGLVLSGFQAGESVAVWGAGPVGLMAAYSGILRGASKVYVVDRVPERLSQAKKIGCIPIDFSKGDPVEQIIKDHGGMVDRAVDAVGYQATSGGSDQEVPNIVLEQIIAVTRPTGGLGIPGLYVPADPGAPDEKAGKGQLLMSFGKLFEKVDCHSSLHLIHHQANPTNHRVSRSLRGNAM